ncbi:hypothetical protein RMAECT_1335 [Rickettsia rhipicephali str. Ect]|uniref:Uncharacterized protein n=1 Tax=Rickettsia rhipicephali str. Ect TaxID=1359199 RepID=A0A0F3PGN0_RICRH|nr:hypothetical protein RMAECT_1335 [Rickettsia rhipicephali str. Ect]
MALLNKDRYRYCKRALLRRPVFPSLRGNYKVIDEAIQ